MRPFAACSQHLHPDRHVGVGRDVVAAVQSVRTDQHISLGVAYDENTAALYFFSMPGGGLVDRADTWELAGVAWTEP